MEISTPENIRVDRSRFAFVHGVDLPWVASPQTGVERRLLEREGGEVARATSFVRYDKGSFFPAHVHELGEEFLVLEGTFSDESGDYPAGTYVRNPPGSRHSPFTREGCVIFVKLRQMTTVEKDRTIVNLRTCPREDVEPSGLSRSCLFSAPDGEEKVNVEMLAPESIWSTRVSAGGEEILVLDGVLDYGSLRCPPMTWLRVPAGQERPISSSDGCRYWVKRGHL